MSTEYYERNRLKFFLMIHGGYIRSKMDAQLHYISARQVAQLYNIPKPYNEEFIRLDTNNDDRYYKYFSDESLIPGLLRYNSQHVVDLYPDQTGTYNLDRVLLDFMYPQQPLFSSTEEALLKTVLSEPKDDTPRLVYADYIQENGNDARAEFIRVQCAIPRTKDDGELKKLKKIERDLLKDNGLNWANQIRPSYTLNHNITEETVCTYYNNKHTAGFTFQRGFIKTLYCDIQFWMNYHPYLYWHPERKYKCSGSYMTSCHHDKGLCVYCHGTGCCQYKMYPTAQPLERVVINGGTTTGVIDVTWPHIEFEINNVTFRHSNEWWMPNYEPNT